MKIKRDFFMTTAVLSLVLLLAACGSKQVDDVAAASDQPGDDEGIAAGFDSETSGIEEGAAGAEAGSIDAAKSALTPIYFEFDQATLTSDARQTLRTHYEFLRNYPQAAIVVEGHCDDRGTDEYNLALGERRAKSVKDYLSSLGVEAGRLSIISYGEERPVVFGSGESSWAKNRRAEFVMNLK